MMNGVGRIMCSLIILGSVSPLISSHFIVETSDAETLNRFAEASNSLLHPVITYPNPSQEVLERFGDYWVITFPVTTDFDGMVLALGRLSGVISVEPSRRLYIDLNKSESDIAAAHDPYTPDDSLLSEQWSVSVTETDLAWDVSTGQGALIAMIDSGVDTTHEDLAGNIDFELSYNFRNENKDVTDLVNHGTSTAGIAAAVINNHVGIAGIAGSSTLAILKVGDQIPFAWIVANGILYAADKGVKIINMSMGGDPDSLISQAVDYAWEKGCFLCASAGNSNVDAAGTYPAAYANVMSVGATDSADQRWIADENKASNFGPSVDIYAPGKDVLATDREGYAAHDGTSYSSPHVAGLAALILSAYPEKTNRGIWNAIISGADTVEIDKGEVLRMNSRRAMIYAGAQEESKVAVNSSWEVVSSIGHEIVLRVKGSPSTSSTPDLQLSIFDALGRKVDNIRITDFSTQVTWGQGYTPGVYFIMGIANCGLITEKIILTD